MNGRRRLRRKIPLRGKDLVTLDEEEMWASGEDDEEVAKQSVNVPVVGDGCGIK